MALGDLAGASEVRALIAGQRFAYPYGFGATARVRAYARGLMESGAGVEVVSLLTPESGDPGINASVRGVHESVPFEYACGTRTRAQTFAGRRLLEAKVPIGLARSARRLFREPHEARVIIAYTDHPGWIVYLCLLARARGARCLVELCEEPFVYRTPGIRRSAMLWLQDAIAYRLVDGFIAISSRLADYAVVHSKGRARVVCIPVLVDVEEFAVARGTAPSTPRRVVYLGDLGHANEITDLLDAFAVVAVARPDVILLLVGDASPERRAVIEARIVEHDLGERVEFAGAVQRRNLPGVLGTATAHVLLRRDADFSRAGLPTKLAEYLASGRPVVVTATGDIPRYLTDARDAYLVPPGDPALFAARLSHALDHAQEAAEVGRRGREVAARRFDFRRHGGRLNAFIRSMG